MAIQSVINYIIIYDNNVIYSASICNNVLIYS